MLRLTRKGQSTAEYAIVIGLVIAAVLAMQVYVKRGIQGQFKDAVDQSPDGGNMFVKGYQYEPDYSTSDMHSTRKATQSIETKDKGEVFRAISDADPEVSKRWGKQGTEALVVK